MELKASDISLRELREQIMLRPQLFIGRELDENGLYFVISHIVKCAVAPEGLNNCTQVNLILHANGYLSIMDDGIGLPTKLKQIDQSVKRPAIEHILTWFLANHLSREYHKEFGFLDYLGTVLNHISAYLNLKTGRNGVLYSLMYSRGKIVSSLRSIGFSKHNGTKITFLPDPQIFPDFKPQFVKLLTLVLPLAQEHPQIRFSLWDKKSGKKWSLRQQSAS